MTLTKSILLASAAAFVAVVAAPAQAADLPTRKSAPAEYVKVCNVGGMAGFVLPGSDTCFKISGSVVAHVLGGDLNKQYAWTFGPTNPAAGPAGPPAPAPVLLPGKGYVGGGATTRSRDDIGFGTRGTVQFDARQDTSFGVLRAFIEAQFNDGSGFANGDAGMGTGTLINYAYIQWAGLTMGKANSFFSFYGGGEGWDNLLSPDQQGYNQPTLFAYTATFGGGFSATIAAQNADSDGVSGEGTRIVASNASTGANATLDGQRAPDIVGNLRIDQAWGAAQVSGVAHDVRATDWAGTFHQDVWGWGVNGGLKINLPALGPGDNFQAQASWTRNAAWFSGLPDAMDGEAQSFKGVSGNGLGPVYADTWSNGDGTWATPTAWSVSALMELHFSPVFWLGPEFSYGEQHWSGLNAFSGVPVNTYSWVGGGALHWDPVSHLDFALELMYQYTHQSTPVTFVPSPGVAVFPNNAEGFVGRLFVTRDF
jgi:hypothetical protein